MNFYFTAAEEQRRIAEKEAIERAEKEEAWEEQRHILKVETIDPEKTQACVWWSRTYKTHHHNL